jgi:hypothetical protein
MGEKNESTDQQERRTASRHLACFPANIQGDDEKQGNIALIRDVSVTGALLLTRESFEVGDTIQLSLYLSEEGKATPHEVTAVVVRSDRQLPDRADVWPFSAAVTFDSPQEHLEARFKQVEAHQKKLGLHRD